MLDFAHRVCQWFVHALRLDGSAKELFVVGMPCCKRNRAGCLSRTPKLFFSFAHSIRSANAILARRVARAEEPVPRGQVFRSTQGKQIAVSCGSISRQRRSVKIMMAIRARGGAAQRGKRTFRMFTRITFGTLLFRGGSFCRTARSIRWLPSRHSCSLSYDSPEILYKY